MTLPATRDSGKITTMCCVFLLSFSLLAFEISMVRILSIMLSYHFVFAVASTALLGLGLGAIFVQFKLSRLGKTKEGQEITIRQAALVAGVAWVGLAMSLSFLGIVKLGAAGVENVAVYAILLLIPFFFGGMFFAEVFNIYPASSGIIHGADLIGAAAGCLGVVYALNYLGGTSAILVFSILLTFSSVIVASWDYWKKKNVFPISTALCFFLVAALFGVNIANPLLFTVPVGLNPAKEIHDSLFEFNGEIIETRWSAFGRTDLVEYDHIPDHKDIYLDGTAGTPMYKFDGDIDAPNEEVKALKNFPGFFPFEFIEETDDQDGEREALIIGPGGGRDILIALMGGIDSITAVEVNRSLVEMVRDYSWYNGGIYTDFEQVNLVIDEGRNYLKRGKNDHFDVIMFTLPVTNTSRSPDGFALTENYLFTTNALEEYMQHLDDEGQLIVVAHDDAEMLRLLTLSLKVLQGKGYGISEAMNHIYMLGSYPNPVFVLSKNPFDRVDIAEKYNTAINELGYNAATSFFPYMAEEGKPLNQILAALSVEAIGQQEVIDMAKEMGYEIRPVSDNNPFFYNFSPGLPGSVSSILWLSLLLTAGTVAGPLLISSYGKSKDNSEGKKKSKYKNKNNSRALEQDNSPGLPGFIAAFTFLGIGYMLVEISLVQRFILYLGQPVLSLTVLLFSLLVGTGLGSFWSSRINVSRAKEAVIKASVAVIFLLLVYNYLIPLLFGYILGYSLLVRALFSVIVLLPLGFAMGISFPLVMRVLKESALQNFIPWMWGINGIGSVMGSVMAIAVAMNWGFRTALLLGALCYLLVVLSFKGKSFASALPALAYVFSGRAWMK